MIKRELTDEELRALYDAQYERKTIPSDWHLLVFGISVFFLIIFLTMFIVIVALALGWNFITYISIMRFVTGMFFLSLLSSIVFELISIYRSRK